MLHKRNQLHSKECTILKTNASLSVTIVMILFVISVNEGRYIRKMCMSYIYRYRMALSRIGKVAPSPFQTDLLKIFLFMNKVSRNNRCLQFWGAPMRTSQKTSDKCLHLQHIQATVSVFGHCRHKIHTNCSLVFRYLADL